ncbi:MAG: hypothetical protein CMG39_06255 [Candidatus Marinimicrobia bacterium]|nr:hypothetical protein [Candidatus Neomarinimicrobiota bacterium]
MKKIFLIFLFFSFAKLDESNWATTRFETFWKKTFKQMTFREPIYFLPYDIRLGYYEYGGLNYFDELDNFLSENDNLESNPYNSTDIDFPDISSKKFRKMVTLELDFLRYNFLKDFQNNIDIHIGFGYKLYKNINKIEFSNGDFLDPEFNEFNVNSTFIKQVNPRYYNYLYLSKGYARASFYNSSGIDANGSGISNHVGLGFNFISKNNNEKSNFHYGIELRFSSLKIDNINEPNNLNRIDDFNMENIGLIFSFGVGYGGNKTLGDKAFMKMLNKNYIDSYEEFKLYKLSDKIYNKSKLDKMVEFSKSQIPYKFYKDAVVFYSNNQFDYSLNSLNKVNYKNDFDLEYKVNSLKYIIADKMLNEFNNNKNKFSIDYQIQFYKDLIKVSPKISKNVNKKLYPLFLQKGDYLFQNNNYEEAYEFYMYSITTGESNPEQIKIKLSNLIISILNEAYDFLEKKENIIAYEKLFFAKNIAVDNNEFIQSLMDILENRKKSIMLDKTQEKMRILISEKEIPIEIINKKEILIGDRLIDIKNILGSPENEISRKIEDRTYKMINYLIDNRSYKLFFKNDILIDIDFE